MIIVDCEQGTPEWRLIRRGIPTATDFESMITAVKGDLSKGSDLLINQIIDEIVRPELQEDSFAGNKHTEHGKEWEPKARQWFEFVHKVKTQQVGFVMRDDRAVGCSPDSLIGDDAGLEIKCPDGPTHVGYLREKKLPDKYKQQVHGSMVVTQRKKWGFLSFCPGYKPFFIWVHWDEYTDKVEKAIDTFLENLEKAKDEILIKDEA